VTLHASVKFTHQAFAGQGDSRRFPFGGRPQGVMIRVRAIWAICGMILCEFLAGCGGTSQFSSQPQNNGNSSVVLALTDSPPTEVTILSAEMTLTGATLAPGNVSLFSGSTTVELARLQTDVAYLATAANVPAGSYTSVTLTFANPSVTFENDTAATLAGCAVGAICTIVPASTTMSASVPLTSFSVPASGTTGLLIDMNLDNLLTATLGADFSAGTSVTSFTPAGTGAPPVGAEDIVGHVGNISASSSTFTLTNATASYNLKVDSSSTFFQFPSGANCASPAFSCLQNNQIVSVDIAIESNGSIVARNIVFEDADSSDAEVEGMITSTNAGSQQFSIVVLTVSGTGTGLNIGATATVQYSTSQTPFAIDFLHIDNFQVSTTSFTSSFNGPADLVPGQQVSIRRNGASGATLIADRVQLRSSRVTATVQSVGAPNITLKDLPSLFSGHGGVTLIQAQTSVTPATIYFEIGASVNASTNITNEVISVRGPLFNSGGTNRTLLTTKVVVK
jgi:uncharacterized protein DUF4382